MSTPLATIADALIEFILSLLRDPSAAAQFAAQPEETLARAGLGGVCVDDVRAVVPVIVDRPEVIERPPVVQVHVVPTPVPVAPRPVEPPTVIKEITSVANHFQIDNRSTIIDQSVNQTIWAKGDVTQIFDQETVLAAGDNSVAAGNNALLDHSQTDLSIGDVAIGNTETNTKIVDSFHDSSSNTEVSVIGVAQDALTADSAAAAVAADPLNVTQPDTTSVIEAQTTLTQTSVADAAQDAIDTSLTTSATSVATQVEVQDASDTLAYVDPMALELEAPLGAEFEDQY